VAEWDQHKADLTLRSRGVGFEEAASVLHDWAALTVEDLGHSRHEQRWRTIGLSDQARMLVVIWTMRQNTVRVISARRATKREADVYQRS
jgi:hypothetical protein